MPCLRLHLLMNLWCGLDIYPSYPQCHIWHNLLGLLLLSVQRPKFIRNTQLLGTKMLHLIGNSFVLLMLMWNHCLATVTATLLVDVLSTKYRFFDCFLQSCWVISAFRTRFPTFSTRDLSNLSTNLHQTPSSRRRLMDVSQPCSCFPMSLQRGTSSDSAVCASQRYVVIEHCRPPSFRRYVWSELAAAVPIVEGGLRQLWSASSPSSASDSPSYSALEMEDDVEVMMWMVRAMRGGSSSRLSQAHTPCLFSFCTESLCKALFSNTDHGRRPLLHLSFIILESPPALLEIILRCRGCLVAGRSGDEMQSVSETEIARRRSVVEEIRARSS